MKIFSAAWQRSGALKGMFWGSFERIPDHCFARNFCALAVITKRFSLLESEDSALYSDINFIYFFSEPFLHPVPMESKPVLSVNCTVLEYEYVSTDRDGHNAVDGVCFKRHNSSCEKAGDVIFYVKTMFGNARLVNRHKCEEGDEPCTLELFHGERTDCHNCMLDSS